MREYSTAKKKQQEQQPPPQYLRPLYLVDLYSTKQRYGSRRQRITLNTPSKQTRFSDTACTPWTRRCVLLRLVWLPLTPPLKTKEEASNGKQQTTNLGRVGVLLRLVRPRPEPAEAPLRRVPLVRAHPPLLNVGDLRKHKISGQSIKPEKLDAHTHTHTHTHGDPAS